MQTGHHASKKVSVLLLGLSVLVVTAFTTAHAATISQPFSISSSLTDWTSGASGIPSLTFQQFNPSLGTLNSVEIQLSSGLTTTLTVTNSSDSPSNGSANTWVRISVTDAGGYIAGNGNTPQISATWPPNGFSYTLGANGSLTSGLLSTTGSSDITYTLAGLLGEFTGTGNITLAASTVTHTLLDNSGGNTDASQVTNAGLTGHVIYDYTAVPLPSALLLLGPGLLGLMGIKRRRAA